MYLCNPNFSSDNYSTTSRDHIIIDGGKNFQLYSDLIWSTASQIMSRWSCYKNLWTALDRCQGTPPCTNIMNWWMRILGYSLCCSIFKSLASHFSKGWNWRLSVQDMEITLKSLGLVGASITELYICIHFIKSLIRGSLNVTSMYNEFLQNSFIWKHNIPHVFNFPSFMMFNKCQKLWFHSWI